MSEKEAEKKNTEKEKEKKEREEYVENRRMAYRSAVLYAVSAIREFITRKKNTGNEEVDEYINSFYSIKQGNKESEEHSSYTVLEKISFLTVIGTFIHSIILMLCYVHSFIRLKDAVITNSPLYLLPMSALPFYVWVKSSDENFWAFHRRKRLFFSLCFVNAVLTVFQPVYWLCWKITAPQIIKIQTNPVLTDKMILLLIYMALLAVFTVIWLLVYRQIEPVVLSKTTWRQIEIFKLKHIKDTRENREYKYDITSIRSLEYGKATRIKENDRFVQMDINGASGTGKTSSIFLSVIRDDLDQKLKNKEKRQEELLKMIMEHKATIVGPLREFRESAIKAIGKNEKEKKANEKLLAEIFSKYSDCGMTIVAPNPSLNKEILRMCQARGFQKVNVLDPAGSYHEFPNAKQVAINPFYLPKDLEEGERVIRISQAASVFADVLIATNQMGGQSDVYFTDISLSVSSNIAAIVMLAKNLKGEQAYIDDIHECISDFRNLTKYVEDIEKHYKIHVEVAAADDKKNNKDLSSIVENIQKGRENKAAEEKDARKNPYYQQILFVKQELLGAGAEAMFSQARGLRNLITKILQDPRIKRKLMGTEDDRIDFDKILSENEITLVSTAIELGQSISTSFGLFFLLLHRTSVLRRPKETRTPHFLWIDECAQYVHPFFDDVIALYRQYRVAAVLTLQTLTQLQKHAATAYLKNVFLGAGTHIVFGRLAPEEMELYSGMAGITREVQEQKSSTSNDVLATNPSYTESSRYTPTVTNNMEGADMRMLDFQELTIFTIDNGRVLPGQFGRVFFVGEEAYDERPYKTVLWEKVVPEAFLPEDIKEADEELEAAAEDKTEEGTEVKDTVPEDAAQTVITYSVPTDEILLGDGEEDMKKLEEMDLNELFKYALNQE